MILEKTGIESALLPVVRSDLECYALGWFPFFRKIGWEGLKEQLGKKAKTAKDLDY